MKKKLLLMLTLCLLAQWSVAQAPKWVDKAKRAVFSVVTYDQNDKILNTGNGFFVTEDGIALSDYTLFKGAQRAVVMSSDGAQMPVEAIMGADDMYDVVKFRVGIPERKSRRSLWLLWLRLSARMYICCLIPPRRTVLLLPGK